MKQFSKLILTAVLGLASSAAFAGDYCFSSGRDCTVPSTDYDDGGYCDNSGYLFGYGGLSFSSNFQSRLLNPFSGAYPFLPHNARFSAIHAPGNETLFGEDEPPREDWDLDSGWIIGGGAGVRSSFLCGSRFEIEGLFTQNDVNRISALPYTGRNGTPVSGFDLAGVDATLSTAAVMMNFLKEIPLGCITGYIGGGLGIASTEVDFSFNSPLSGLNYYGSDRDFALAHQFIVGADIPVSDCLSLFLQYKLFNAGDLELVCPGAERGFDKVASIDSFYQSHLVFGARFFY